MQGKKKFLFNFTFVNSASLQFQQSQYKVIAPLRGPPIPKSITEYMCVHVKTAYKY